MGAPPARCARAVELGDGWAPFGLALDDMAAMIAKARDTEAWEQRTTPIELALQSKAFDPIADPEGTREALARMEAIGTTVVEARLVHHSLDHYIEQLAALAAIGIA